MLQTDAIERRQTSSPRQARQRLESPQLTALRGPAQHEEPHRFGHLDQPEPQLHADRNQAKAQRVFALAEKALFASSGDFYATTVCDRYGIESLLRVGCACYTTDDEVARLIAAVAEL